MNQTENIKIREDAIRIQEKDVADTCDGIKFETTKISFALAFLSIVTAQSLKFVLSQDYWYKILFIILLLVAFGAAMFSLFAKKTNVHTNVDPIFADNSNDNWKQYLEHRHNNLKDIKTNADKLLKSKVKYTKTTFILLSLVVLYLIIGVLI
jgi:activator of 2-hydroxyglutaryl-CoA dehydratase